MSLKAARQVLLAVISRVVQCRVPPFRQVRVGVIVFRKKNLSSAKVSLVRAGRQMENDVVRTGEHCVRFDFVDRSLKIA